MRSFAMICLAVVGAGNARASFDLMYDAGAGTKAIHRLDPINNVYLGKFGQGLLNSPISVALGTGTDVYVLDNGPTTSKKFRATGVKSLAFSQLVSKVAMARKSGLWVTISL